MILVSLVAFSLTAIMLLLLIKTPLSRLAPDHPNHRSLHTRVIPRTGGLGLMSGVLTAWMWSGVAWIWMLPVSLLVMLSLLDDIYGLKVRWRLIVQLAICAGFIWITLPANSAYMAIMMVLALVWMLNLYNFMDGSDGLAGGMALIGFGAYAIAAFEAGDAHLAQLSCAIAASSIAFLLFNFHPARIFMGDSGSIPLGFIAGGMGVYGWHNGIWHAWFPLLVFSTFIFDATLTLITRALRREQLWQAHRTHYYQRLVQMGYGHRKTAVGAYVLMLTTSATAILLREESSDKVMCMLAVWLVIYGLLAYIVDKKWKTFKRV